MGGRTFIFTVFILLTTLSGQCANRAVSDVSLLTCSPGSDLYSVFGHSAIRVKGTWQEQPIDWVYNYGTFNFDDDFYINFARGKLNYSLSRSHFSDFEYSYMLEGRGMQEQVLALSEIESLALFDFLEWNYEPENRDYPYDFFYDNCASRIRDVFRKVLGDALIFPYTLSAQKSFRDMIQDYLNDMPWSDLGIDLALGLPCDAQVLKGEEMFLPDYLHDNFEEALYAKRPLVKSEYTLLENRVHMVNHFWRNPLFIFSAFSFFVLIWMYKKGPQKRRRRLMNGVYIFSGFIGLLLFLLWFATDHLATKDNLNLLWAMPLLLFMPFARPQASWVNKLIISHMMLLFALIVGWPWLPQQLHPSLIPWILLILGAHWTFLKINTAD